MNTYEKVEPPVGERLSLTQQLGKIFTINTIVLSLALSVLGVTNGCSFSIGSPTIIWTYSKPPIAYTNIFFNFFFWFLLISLISYTRRRVKKQPSAILYRRYLIGIILTMNTLFILSFGLRSQNIPAHIFLLLTYPVMFFVALFQADQNLQFAHLLTLVYYVLMAKFFLRIHLYIKEKIK